MKEKEMFRANKILEANKSKLEEKDKEIARKVVDMYREDKHSIWVTRKALSALAFHGKDEHEYLADMHSMVTAVVCAMVKMGTLKIVEKEVNRNV